MNARRQVPFRKKTTLEPGERIVLDPGIKQPEDVFTPVTYREFLKRWKSVLEEYKRLYDLDLRYNTPEERLNSPEARQMKPLREQFILFIHEYRRRLPIHLLAQCPYCGSRILQPVDSFSLVGFYGFFNAAELYHGSSAWVVSQSPRHRCKHAVVADFSVNLNGLTPDDLPNWMVRMKSLGLDSSPLLVVWLLVARRTSAVIHALPIGRLDDPEPVHRYTAYFVTYFAGDDTNLHAEEMWVSDDVGRPAVGGAEVDDDLVKWVEARRLFWLDPNDPEHPLARGPVEAFPYADVQPKGWYKIEGGEMKGPYPYYRSMWQGKPPPEDESFPRSTH